MWIPKNSAKRVAGRKNRPPYSPRMSLPYFLRLGVLNRGVTGHAAKNRDRWLQRVRDGGSLARPAPRVGRRVRRSSLPRPPTECSSARLLCRLPIVLVKRTFRSAKFKSCVGRIYRHANGQKPFLELPGHLNGSPSSAQNKYVYYIFCR